MNTELTCPECKKSGLDQWELHECPTCQVKKCHDCINYNALKWVDGHRLYECTKCNNTGVLNGNPLAEKVLSPQELEDLMKVPTTVEEARQIKERNERLLELLEKNEDGYVAIGCPHCSYSSSKGFSCKRGERTCRWYKYPGVHKRYSMPCVYVPFGGISYADVSRIINYESSCAQVKNTEAEFSIYKKQKQQAKIFLKGHIEWAEAVISKYEQEEENGNP